MWLVLPEHLGHGLVRVVVFVICSVMILGVGHCVTEADLFAEPVDVPLRKGAELEDTTASDDVETPVRRSAELDEGTVCEDLDSLRIGAELVAAPAAERESGVSTAVELVPLRKGPCEDWLGKDAEPDGWTSDEVLARAGAVPEKEGSDEEPESVASATALLLMLRKTPDEDASGKLAEPDGTAEGDVETAADDVAPVPCTLLLPPSAVAEEDVPLRNGAELVSGGGTMPVEAARLDEADGSLDGAARLDCEGTSADDVVPFLNGAEVVSGAGMLPVEAARSMLDD